LIFLKKANYFKTKHALQLNVAISHQIKLFSANI